MCPPRERRGPSAPAYPRSVRARRCPSPHRRVGSEPGMRRRSTVGMSVALLTITVAAAGCGGGDGGGGGGGEAAKSLTVWTIEDVADRVEATKRLTQRFTSTSG